MRWQAEVSGAFDRAEDASHLLYVPLSTPGLTARQTRCYTLDFEGDADALVSFLERTLADPVSHRIVHGGAPAFSGWVFHLDYAMKSGALDLEKEAILRYHREDPDAAFSLQRLTIHRRVYLFDADHRPETRDLANRFVRDIVNPAIHTWSVTAA